jgi:hypothetical protein
VKGDSSVRVFEFDGSSLQPIVNTTTADAARGVALAPKQINDLMGCEVLQVILSITWIDSLNALFLFPVISSDCDLGIQIM